MTRSEAAGSMLRTKARVCTPPESAVAGRTRTAMEAAVGYGNRSAIPTADLQNALPPTTHPSVSHSSHSRYYWLDLYTQSDRRKEARLLANPVTT